MFHQMPTLKGPHEVLGGVDFRSPAALNKAAATSSTKDVRLLGLTSELIEDSLLGQKSNTQAWLLVTPPAEMIT